MKPPLAVATLSMASLIAVAAFAQFRASPSENFAADTNGDGRVSLTEYQNSRRILIMQADRNRDSKVTKAEWDIEVQSIKNKLTLDGIDGANKIGHGGWWEMTDLNKDGVVTPAEINIMTKARFAQFDLDKNGLIDQREASAVDQKTGLQRRG